MRTNEKLEKLLATARQETAPVPRENWAGELLRATRQARLATEPSSGLTELLAGLLPRVAVASAALIVLCVLADLALAAGQPDLQTEAAAAAEEFLFVAR